MSKTISNTATILFTISYESIHSSLFNHVCEIDTKQDVDYVAEVLYCFLVVIRDSLRIWCVDVYIKPHQYVRTVAVVIVLLELSQIVNE